MTTLRFQSSLPPTIIESNIAKFVQNEEMRAALENTGVRRLAEASLHDEVWGIDLMPVILVRPHLVWTQPTRTGLRVRSKQSPAILDQ